MTTHSVRGGELSLATQDAELLQSILEQRLLSFCGSSVEIVTETVAKMDDALWLARWLGEDARLELTAEQIDCLLQAVEATTPQPPLVRVRQRLESFVQITASHCEAVAV